MDKKDLDKWSNSNDLPIIEFMKKPSTLYSYELCFNDISKSRKAGASNLMADSESGSADDLLITLKNSARKIIRKRKLPYILLNLPNQRCKSKVRD